MQQSINALSAQSDTVDTMDRMSRFMRKGKSLILAYDQGLEHGPTDFNEKNVDPQFVLDIAGRCKFDAFASQKGVAENYWRKGGVPLILKVNGKTALYGGSEPLARQNCSVKHAWELGAAAVGYTVYVGSANEAEMLAEFGRVQEEAHALDMAAILWAYARGASVKNDTSREVIAYATRLGLELGADAVKVKYTGDKEGFRWVVKAAGRVPVYMAGGPKTKDEQDFLTQVKGCMEAGASGVAVGRNVWQSDNPDRTSKRLAAIVIDGKSVEQAMKLQ